MNTFTNHQIDRQIALGQSLLRKAFRFIERVRDLSPDPLANYSKFKVLKGLKQPACKWSDPRNHTKEPIDQTFYNTGIPTGSLNNLLIVDVDVKDRGMEEFCKFTNSFGVVPTLTVSTPSGGLHLYFNYNSTNPADDQKVKSHLRTKTRFRGVGIDVRGEGGYIVAPLQLQARGLII